MRKVKIVKESQHSKEVNPNGIHPGYTVEGTLLSAPEVGMCVWVTGGRGIRTSPVTEIISETTFKTLNSTYVMEFLDEDETYEEETESNLEE